MALFVFSLCPFDISRGVGAFVIGLSQISSFLSLLNLMHDDCFLGYFLPLGTFSFLLMDTHKLLNCPLKQYKSSSHKKAFYTNVVEKLQFKMKINIPLHCIPTSLC